ncbi:hypothetical protein [Azorhizobium caulinodans]|uniref:hypothetical protein n=1 Tax=Azorhizobium caulinodans TaxID=7 RepID=UPI002FBD9AEB
MLCFQGACCARLRADLAAHPDLDPSGAPVLIATIDRVVTWVEANPPASIPAAARQSTRAGRVAPRDQIRTEADSIRAQRTAKGLENP